MQDFEKLGIFYLGREFDLAKGEAKPDLLLYESKDLTTHAVCVGMTGSGKTGLCLALLEEAAIDGLPAIAIDPKGDLGNLLLTFPALRGEDFRPWVDPAEAARKGRTPVEHAQATAELWKQGLADWGQDGARIARFRNAVDLAIYTPGSSAGQPLSILRSLTAPPAAVVDDADALRERVTSVVSALLALVGIPADPIRSREHMLLALLVDRAWREGRSLDLGSLIREIQTPPFERVGVLDLESFFPTKDRTGLALAINGLLASPGFAAWTEGEPLDVGRLLYTAAGKPRVSILSIAHLSDSERMFFVTILLNEVIAWMRAQPGTSSLRALLYMDEIFGYFPPTANPPSKTPMLTLLKQARAYGVGVVLATQNPVDLDYKGLANAGTWFLGRLQTERDKMRVIEGLEGASATAGKSFDRARMEATLAGLGSRVFLMNNVHQDEPVVFQSRWALSYLRGPLTRAQIRELTAAMRAAAPPAVSGVAAPSAGAAPSASVADSRPIAPPEAGEVFLPWRGSGAVVYRPAVLTRTRVRFVVAKQRIDYCEPRAWLAPLDSASIDSLWEGLTAQGEDDPEREKEPAPSAHFAELPAAAARGKTWTAWTKSLTDHLYRTATITLRECPAMAEFSKPGESEAEFRLRLGQRLRERRDLETAKLEKKYAPALAKLKEQIARAEDRVEREKAQYDQQKLASVVSIGTTVLGALFGRKTISVASVGRASTAMRGIGRAAQERGDVARAAESVEALQQKVADLEAEFQAESARIADSVDPTALDLVETQVRPKKTEIQIAELVLAWVPSAAG